MKLKVSVRIVCWKKQAKKLKTFNSKKNPHKKKKVSILRDSTDFRRYRKNVILSMPQSQSTQNMCYGCTGTTVRKPCVFTSKAGQAPRQSEH